MENKKEMKCEHGDVEIVTNGRKDRLVGGV